MKKILNSTFIILSLSVLNQSYAYSQNIPNADDVLQIKKDFLDIVPLLQSSLLTKINFLHLQNPNKFSLIAFKRIQWVFSESCLGNKHNNRN